AGIDQYLTDLDKSGVTGFAAIPCDVKKPDKISWPESKVQEWVRDIGTNDNVAWWDFPEEARPWVKRETKLLTDYTAWTRANDPGQRPTFEYTPNNRNP